MTLFVFMYDFCEEIEVNNKEEDQESSSQTSKAGSKRPTGGQAKGGCKRKCKKLNKEEKVQVMLSISDVNIDLYVKDKVSKERHSYYRKQ